MRFYRLCLVAFVCVGGQVVTQGGYKQHVPIRCTLCTSRSQPHGKVVDAVSMHPKDVRKFLGQHLQTDCHNRALGALAAKNAAQDGEQTLEEVPCEAVILKFDLEAEGAATKLHAMVHHVQQWMSWQKQDCGLQKHSYKLTQDCGRNPALRLHAHCGGGQGRSENLWALQQAHRRSEHQTYDTQVCFEEVCCRAAPCYALPFR